MARAPKLKVFRTPVGFHDAYVAAPSQTAAVEAWGSDRDVFRRGEAEEVADAELTREPLANPGQVIKRLRASAEEQLAALPPNKPPRNQRRAKASPARVQPKARPRPMPRPSRAALEEVEEAVEATRAKHEAQLEAVRRKEAAIATERAKLEKAQSKEIEGLSQKLDRETRRHQEALERWRES